MKNNLIFLALLMFMSSSVVMNAQPNIIFIFADDLGWGDLGCYGHSRLRTPHLDKMADNGLLLTNFYVSGPVCSPSRTAVMTGQYPARHRIHTAINNDPERNRARSMPDYLDPDETMVTRLLQQEGYRIGHFGKWHLGNVNAPPPEDYGIDVNYTINSSNAKLDVPRHQSTEAMVNEAIRFLEEHKDQRFYMNVWTLVPHAALDPTDEQMAPYERFSAKRGAAARGFSTPTQIYYSAVTDLDKQLGRLIDKVEELGLNDETIIIFSSDNGPEDIHIPAAAHSGVGSSGPFRGRKRSLYEGGIRMPFIVQWKGQIDPGTVDNHSVVGAVDLLPTFCSLADIALPDDYEPDGQDVSALFEGKTIEREKPLLWDWNWIQRGHVSNISPGLALRDGKWKFLMNPDQSRIELYDFEADPQCMEVDNVADKYPEIVKKYKKMLLDFEASVPQADLSDQAGDNTYHWPGRVPLYSGKKDH